ncbi:hypothetical protein Cgig2_015007 [Carnegiea gigantea]|uniref:Uncharacterized protein n=1 Tax=Carnegiea gigantea TaxID=171969 RepID=A0A9Q1GN60_9CARY|nr:hypothetical protein Cgig2_015007 [Carnegiea gigantea]
MAYNGSIRRNVGDQKSARKCYIATLKATVQHSDIEVGNALQTNKRQALQQLEMESLGVSQVVGVVGTQCASSGKLPFLVEILEIHPSPILIIDPKRHKRLVHNSADDAIRSKLARPNPVEFQQPFVKGRKRKPQAELEMLLKNGIKPLRGLFIDPRLDRTDLDRRPNISNVVDYGPNLSKARLDQDRTGKNLTGPGSD